MTDKHMKEAPHPMPSGKRKYKQRDTPRPRTRMTRARDGDSTRCGRGRGPQEPHSPPLVAGGAATGRTAGWFPTKGSVLSPQGPATTLLVPTPRSSNLRPHETCPRTLQQLCARLPGLEPPTGLPWDGSAAVHPDDGTLLSERNEPRSPEQTREPQGHVTERSPRRGLPAP